MICPPKMVLVTHPSTHPARHTVTLLICWMPVLLFLTASASLVLWCWCCTEKLADCLRLPAALSLQAQVFLCFRVLLLRLSSQHLTALWPTIITELVSWIRMSVRVLFSYHTVGVCGKCIKMVTCLSVCPWGSVHHSSKAIQWWAMCTISSCIWHGSHGPRKFWFNCKEVQRACLVGHVRVSW